MNPKIPTLTCMILLATTACTEQPAAPTVEPAATNEAAPAKADITDKGALSERKAPDIDEMAALAGNFGGLLPCADCAGIDTTLALAADGHYVLTRDYQGEAHKDGNATSEGSWTLEADATQVRLDPASKTAPDRLYAVTSHDVLTMLSADGTPAASELDYRLQRQRAR